MRQQSEAENIVNRISQRIFRKLGLRNACGENLCYIYLYIYTEQNGSLRRPFHYYSDNYLSCLPTEWEWRCVTDILIR